jgi:hypothetical protein
MFALIVQNYTRRLSGKMNRYEFDIKAVLVVSAQNINEAEKYLKETIGGGELFNIQVNAKPIPQGIEYSGGKIYEMYEVNWK